MWQLDREDSNGNRYYKFVAPWWWYTTVTLSQSNTNS